jgi:hypothetical protein
MKKIPSVVIITALMLLTIFSLIIVANASTNLFEYTRGKNINNGGNPIEFYAKISFTVFEGEGCACEPIPLTSISAYGRDTDHFDTNITDIYGFCVLELEYDATYRVTVEIEEFQKVIYDFKVLDDQPFSIHLQEIEESSNTNRFFTYNVIQHLIKLKK